MVGTADTLVVKCALGSDKSQEREGLDMSRGFPEGKMTKKTLG